MFHEGSVFLIQEGIQSSTTEMVPEERCRTGPIREGVKCGNTSSNGNPSTNSLLDNNQRI